jgi:tetratricopeptide (TPR) repeat protein
MEDRFRFSLPPRPRGTPVTDDELERILRALVAKHPEGSRAHGAALWQLMRFLGLTGRQMEALEILGALLGSTVEPEARATITLGIGQIMERLGDYRSASAAYLRGVALEPVRSATWYLLHNNLGYCLNQSGRHVEAEHWCRAAIQIDPLRHNAHKNLGLAFQGQGRYVEAARCLIQAVHCEAGDPRALEHLRELVETHPEIETEMPNIHGQIESGGMAVEAAKVVRMKQCFGIPPGSQST